MSATGPELPPHLLAKRKRQQEEEEKDKQSTASGANTHDKRQRVQGPAAPTLQGPDAAPTLQDPDAPRPQKEQAPSTSPPPRRIAGPAPPPAPLDERPSEPANPYQPSPDDDSDSDSDSDDDFGPTLPSAQDTLQATRNATNPSLSHPSTAPAKAQRDEWMTLPPQQDDLAARMDPSKLRSRGFNTGKSARGGAAPATMGAAWTETPEQKLKRLQDEAMGVKPYSTPGEVAKDRAKSAERDALARRLRDHTDKTRGPSLMQQHQQTNPQGKEDDPSKRAFDREIDMGAGGRLGHAEKKEMLNKASNFSDKFSGGGYL